MLSVPVSHLALVDEEEATSPAVFSSGWSIYKNFVEQPTLPAPLLFMIHYAISNAKECQYCTTAFEFACRSVGIEDTMLEAMIHDLESVNPSRVREIIKFAVQCAIAPRQLTQENYDRLRDQSVTEEELIEIIGWSAIAMYNDTISDALKLASGPEQEFIED